MGIDLVIQICVIQILAGQLGAISGWILSEYISGSGTSGLIGIAVGLFFGRLFGPIVLFPVYGLIEVVAGASIGKMIVGLEIRRSDGEAPSVFHLFARYALKNSFVVIPVIGAAVAYFSGRTDTFKIMVPVWIVATGIVWLGYFRVLVSGPGVHDSLSGTDVFPSLQRSWLRTGAFVGVGALLVMGLNFTLGAMVLESLKQAKEQLAAGEAAIQAASKEPPKIDPDCGLKNLPEDFEVHYIKVYQGSRPVEYQLGESAEASEEKVIVGATAKPVVLVLNSATSVLWEVGVTKEAKLAGVLVTSSRQSGLTGVDPRVPQAVYSSENRNQCPAMTWVDSDHIQDYIQVAYIRRHVGKSADRFHGKKQGQAFEIGQVTGQARYAADQRRKFMRNPSLIPVGDKGIKRLLQQGFLKMATEKDLASWKKGASKHYQVDALANLERQVDGNLKMNRVYRMVKQTNLPPGLHGAHSIVLIVPAGLTPPTERGHSTLLLAKDFTCQNAWRHCNMELK